MSCTNSGGPPMNTDISGIGVRVSFYLQTLFLGFLSARSPSLDEVTGSFYTLLATNTGMAVSALILGLKPMPEISFHDALVVFYLLYLSWVTVFFSLPSATRFPGNVKMQHLCSVIQSYTVFAFVFAMLITARNFGSTPECNPNAVVVLFRPFAALEAGRILFCVMTGLVFILYTAMLIKDHRPPKEQMRYYHMLELFVQQTPDLDAGEAEAPTATTAAPNIPETTGSSPPNPPKYVPPSQRRKVYNLQIDWTLVGKLAVVLILWALAVMNTELLILWNHFAPSDDNHSQWQFGQVLPMFLVALSLISVVNTFRENGLRKLPVKSLPPV